MRLPRALLLLLALLPAAASAADSTLEVRHAPPAFAQGTELRFEAMVPSAETATALLLWRHAGDAEFQPESMKKMGAEKGASRYVAVLPWTRTGGDIEYYLQVYYGAGLANEVYWASAGRPQALTLPKPAPTAAPVPPMVVVQAQEGKTAAAGPLPKPAPAMALASAGGAVRAKDESQRSPAPYLLFAAGAAAAGAGVVLGLGVKSAADEFHTAQTQDQYAAKVTDARSKAKTATVVWVAAGALAATGVALFLFKF